MADRPAVASKRPAASRGAPSATVADLLVRVSRAGLDQVRGVAGRMGLTLPQAWLLPAIARLGPVPATGLARETDHTLPALTSALDALERQGLVRRERSSGDRRQVLVNLTPKGRTTLRTLARRVHAVHLGINRAVGARDRESLLRGLLDIGETLDPRHRLTRVTCPYCARESAALRERQ
ncbi:MAG TPA: MarR family transcriptional regulator [Thermoplasmata archaeon]|nr:MarR family transcriptional regulator [Thermoplasmata archaeon]